MKSLLPLLAAAMAFPAQGEPVRPPVTGVSHIAIYAADTVKSERFYTHSLGAVKRPDPENSTGTRYYVSGSQFIEVLPLPDKAGKNRLDHIAFATTDAEAMRQYLAGKGVKVAGAVTVAPDGGRSISAHDPEGNRVDFVEAQPLSDVTPNPLSAHIIHVGMVVHDRALEDSFYRDILGFRPYWYGGFDETNPRWISQQVADGSDWIEYMLAEPETGQGIPDDMTQKTAGILNHFSLGVTDIRVPYTQLWNEGHLDGQDELPKIGRDAKWQLNLYDPDGTRAEIMELHAVGKPCCSAFTAADPVQ